jgi:iron(III) transport system permease protein
LEKFSGSSVWYAAVMLAARRATERYGLAVCLACLGLTGAVLWLTADEPVRRLLVNTLVLCGGVATISVPPGMLLAILLTRTNVGGRNLGWLLLLTLLFLPLHSTAAGWVALFGKLGSQSSAFFQTTQPLVNGMPAVVWIHSMAAIPWVTLIISLGLWTIPREVEEAALLDVSPVRFFLGLGLRYFFPFVMAAGLWAVITTAGEMTVTNLYMVSTYAEELYNSVAQGADAPTAGIRLLPGICGTALLACSVCGLIAALLPAGLGKLFQRPRVYRLGAWHPSMTIVSWCMLLLVFGVPLVSLALKAGMVKQAVAGEHVRSWSLAALGDVLLSSPYRFRAEFGYSALFAASGAVVALVVALPLAAWARRGGIGSLPAIVTVAVCWAIPGPLVGMSLSWLLNWNFAPLIFLYDKTPLAPALAMGVKALPVTILILWMALASIPQQTLEAARLDGAEGFSLFWRIILPQRAAAIAAAGMIAFAIGLADLAWSILVLPPGMETVQRRVFGLIHYGVEEQVAGVSLVTLAVFFLLALGVGYLSCEFRKSTKPT